jgi:hypothetical protein
MRLFDILLSTPNLSRLNCTMENFYRVPFFWDMTLCQWVIWFQRFETKYFPIFIGQYTLHECLYISRQPIVLISKGRNAFIWGISTHECEDTTLPLYVGINLPIDTAPYPRGKKKRNPQLRRRDIKSDKIYTAWREISRFEQ